MSEDTTQQLLSARLDQILSLVQETNGRLQNLESEVKGINDRLQKLEVRAEATDARIQALERKVDERLHDTRPIWERVLQEITKINERLDTMQADVRGMRRMMSTMNDELLKIKSDQRDLDDRVYKLEPKT